MDDDACSVTLGVKLCRPDKDALMPMTTWNIVKNTAFGPRYFLLLAIGEEALKDMLRSHDAAMDRIKVLSIYFETKDASDALEKMKTMKDG